MRKNLKSGFWVKLENRYLAAPGQYRFMHRGRPRHPAVANKVGLKFPALGGEPKDFNCTFPWHGGHQTSQSKDKISKSGSG